MSVFRLLGPVVLALAVAGPHAAAAQTAGGPGDALAAQTKAYFNAVLRADGAALANEVSPSFHFIRKDGATLDYPTFIRDTMRDSFEKQNPMGVNVSIKASSQNGSHVTETVAASTWWSGATSDDPLSGPIIARTYETHQLTWTKSANGTWLVDEDHLTQLISSSYR